MLHIQLLLFLLYIIIIIEGTIKARLEKNLTINYVKTQKKNMNFKL